MSELKKVNNGLPTPTSALTPTPPLTHNNSEGNKASCNTNSSQGRELPAPTHKLSR